MLKYEDLYLFDSECLRQQFIFILSNLEAPKTTETCIVKSKTRETNNILHNENDLIFRFLSSRSLSIDEL